jgi:propanol-preferring alcohol dehydrogenase
MKAMVLNELCSLQENKTPLELTTLPDPVPGDGELLVKVSACGVCHTELDEIEGRTPPPQLPIVLGHQVVGHVEASGDDATRFTSGDRVGVAWIYSACGSCKFCLGGDENLCADFKATGRDAHGGYAGYMTVPEDFAHPIPDIFSDIQAAPLLCAGAIGYRSLRLTGLQDGGRLGLTGFGASGHITLKLAKHLYPSSDVFVFARSEKEREFAGIAREAGRHHRHHTGMEAGRRGAEDFGARRQAGDQRDPQRGRRQGLLARPRLPRSSVDGKGNKERGQRRPARCRRVPGASSRDAAHA